MLELILAMTILVIGLIPLLLLLGNVRQGISSKDSHVDASVIAQNYFCLLQTKKWDENSPDVGVFTNSRSETLGPESEATADSYDDIDDFNGAVIDIDSRHRVSFSVAYVKMNKNGKMVDQGAPTDYKSVAITVTISGVHPYSTTIKSLFANSNSKVFNG